MVFMNIIYLQLIIAVFDIIPTIDGFSCFQPQQQQQQQQQSKSKQFPYKSKQYQTQSSDTTTTNNNNNHVHDHDTTFLNKHDIFNSNTNNAIGLYVHIPYCRRRCRYCNFAIVPIGSNVQTEVNTVPTFTNTTSKQQQQQQQQQFTTIQKQEAVEDTISTFDKKMTQGFLDMDKSYRTTILQEIALLRNKLQQQQQPIVLQSIYFGGGTPSLAPIETIQSIMDALIGKNSTTDNPLFTLTSNAEITIEMDPGTFSFHKLHCLKEMGFNRISLGVQSFDDSILESIGRIHRKRDIYNAIEMINRVFGTDHDNDNNNNNDVDTDVNYSIDLISGLPGLSLALWAETLATATSLKPRPSHISLYDLQIEQGTVFGKWYSKNENTAIDYDDKSTTVSTSQALRGSLPISLSPSETKIKSNGIRKNLPSEEDCAFMYKYAAGYLRAKGYEHYEVSSYAYVGNNGNENNQQEKNSENRQATTESFQKSNRSQHNQIYWRIDGNWFALGLGSTSFVNGRMTTRPRTLADYSKWIQGKTNNRHNHNHNEDEEDDIIYRLDFLTDVIMKRLRTSDGLDLDWIVNNYGKSCLDTIMKGASLGLELGLMQIIIPGNETNDSNSEALCTHGVLRLVDPEGFLYSNNLISSIFVELGEYQDHTD